MSKESIKSLRDCCHVNSNDAGDNFVGVKVDSRGAMVYFPIGYQLPPDDDQLRLDINNLLSVLAAFGKEDKSIEEPAYYDKSATDFPLHAYLRVLYDFLRTGRYYVETDPCFKTDTKHKISWARTVREQKPCIQKNGSLIFTKMTVRYISPNVNKQITQIHKYCVYEAFDKIGWLYVSYMPEKPRNNINIKEAIALLQNKRASTHNDIEQELFAAMESILKYIDDKPSQYGLSFGTYFFERIWEKMIDKAFGIKSKNQFFPRTQWHLDYGSIKTQVPLQPDSIMLLNNNIYVLDAKLYRYGCSGNPEHLPSGPDINKQITYGEYIEKCKKIPNSNLFNAFIMPFNSAKHPFMQTSPDGRATPLLFSNIENIGEAIGDWKPDLKYYERIQGIVVDTRFLIYNYSCMSEQQKLLLAFAIEKVKFRDLTT